MNKGIIFFGISIIILTALYSGCLDKPKDIVQLSITSFNAEPSIINQGETANLSWVVVGATSVSIDNGIGNVSLIGNQIITPTETTTYTLTAKNATETLNATTRIIVIRKTEEAGVVVKATNDSFLQVTLVSAGQSYDNGYTDFSIYVNSEAVINLPSSWIVGQHILIGQSGENYTVGGERLTTGDYWVTISILDTAVFDGRITIT